MWLTIFVIVFIILLTLILHDMGKILKIQDELIKEQYLMRGELNAILDMASLGTSFIPSMFETTFSKESMFHKKEEKDETTTVEINETKPE